jgi:hypothetical protein|tara:strand:+ start:791 stop:1039 length:249 start_codon:yes stop_codon:yes gene_type:complete
MGGLIGGSAKPDTSAAEESLRMQREQTAKATKQAQDEKREIATGMAAKKKALARGGSRMLLAEGRLTPETGIDDDEYKKTLG